MQSNSDRDRLRLLLFETMPPPPDFCLLCGGEPDRVGAGRIDGATMAYAICQQCLGPDDVDRVIAKVRGSGCCSRRN